MRHGLESLHVYESISSLTDILQLLAPDAAIEDTALQYGREVIGALQSYGPLPHTERLIEELAPSTCNHVGEAINIIIEVLSLSLSLSVY